MRTEKTFILIFVVGLIFKFFHLPSGSTLIVISLCLLASLYFPGAFYFFCDKLIKRQNLPLSIISGLFFSLIALGILFKVQYWMGGQTYLSLGMIAALIILFVVIYLKPKAKEELVIYYHNMLIRTSFLLALSMLFYFTSTETLLKIQYRDDPTLARLKFLHYSNPSNAEYRKQHDDYLRRRDSTIQ